MSEWLYIVNDNEWTTIYTSSSVQKNKVQVKAGVMNNYSAIIDLALANLLDVIPLISNTDENVDQALLRIYDRNAAIVNAE